MPTKRTMKGTRVLTSIYLDPPVYEALKQLSATTRVPQSVYLREALDDLLAKYKVKVPAARRAKR
jgi:predicted DNA-binding protein